MTFNEFTSLIQSKLEEIFSSSGDVRITEVKKNNGIVLTGVTVIRKEINISPTIYLNDYYVLYEQNQKSIDEIIEEIVDIYDKHDFKENYNVSNFINIDAIKSRIIFKIVNYDMNENLLKEVPHFKFLDLAMIFQVLVSDATNGNATILIHNEHVKMWDIYPDELKYYAIKNTPVYFPVDIQSMADALKGMLEAELTEIPVDMWVLTNANRINGASVLLYENVLGRLSKMFKTNLYLFPSSIHEWIILPEIGGEDTKQMRDLIRDINISQVAQEEILSYNLYYYNQETSKVEIIK